MQIEKHMSQTKQMSINISNNRINSIRKKSISKTCVRVFKNRYIGLAGIIGDYSEEKLLSNAIENLKNKTSYPYELSKGEIEVIANRNRSISEESFLNEIEELVNIIKEEHRNIVFSNHINISERKTSISNTKGLKLYYSDSQVAANLLFREKDSLNIIDGVITYKAREFDKCKFKNYIDMICGAYENKTSPLKAGMYPICFLSYERLPFMKFIEDLNSECFIKHDSIMFGKLGEKLFNDNFTLYQSLDPIDVQMKPFFDAEGVVNNNYRYALIENGIIMSPYTSKRTSSILNLPNTGSAICEYDDIPGVGYTNFSLKPTKYMAKSLLNNQMGILVVITHGGGFIKDGSFSASIQLPMLYDGEKIVGRLPEIQISSNLYEMYGKCFRGVSSNGIFPFCDDKIMVIDMNVSML